MEDSVLCSHTQAAGAQVCAECHHGTHAGPELAKPSPPAPTATLRPAAVASAPSPERPAHGPLSFRGTANAGGVPDAHEMEDLELGIPWVEAEVRTTGICPSRLKAPEQATRWTSDPMRETVVGLTHFVQIFQGMFFWGIIIDPSHVPTRWKFHPQGRPLGRPATSKKFSTLEHPEPRH